MKVELSKRQKAIARDLAARAYEREMGKLLTPLAQAFEQWRAGKKGTWDLVEEIDRVAVPRRRLSQRYDTNSIAPMMVAHAIVVGLLREDEVPGELVQALEKPIAFYRRGLADGSVSMEEED